MSLFGPKKDGLCVEASVEHLIHPEVSVQLYEWQRTARQHAVTYMQEIAALTKSHPTQGEPLNFSKGMELSFHFADHFSRGMETSSSSFHFPDRLAKEREHHYHFIFQTNSTLQSVSDIRVFDVPDLSVFDVAVIPGIIVGLAVGLYTDGYGNDSL